MAKTYIPTDPLFGAQWHLLNIGQDIMGLPQEDGAYRNDINVTSVWPDYTGEGVVVAVMDNGFQASHPDIAPNYLADKSYYLTRNQPGQVDGDHGTATLGLIAAAQNDLGGVGVAYGAKAIGYTTDGVIERSGLVEIDNFTPDFIKATARMLMDGVSVSSNSWGMPLRQTPFQDAAKQDIYAAAYTDLVSLGRDGLGISVLFAAGNNTALSTQVKQNTNFYPTTSLPQAIVVGAATVEGKATDYTIPGANVLVAAPGSGTKSTSVPTVSEVSSIVTTDLLGEAGLNKTPDGDYTNLWDEATHSHGFNGTSAATPIAAGVVALMLEANPNLGYRDIQEILAYSAKTPDGVAEWKTNGSSDWNGGGLLYDDHLGFGLIDAHAAVRLAETWQKQSTYDNLVTLTQSVSGSTDALVVAAGQARHLDLSFEDLIRVQHATLSINAGVNAGFGSLTGSLEDISISLTGPDGVTTDLFMDPSYYQFVGVSGPLRFSFDTVHNWGELSNSGNWTVNITNNGDADLVIYAELALLGDAVSAGETFIYTDDYARLGTDDIDRTILSSTQAGPHTLNAAAVTTDTTVNLCCDEANIAGVVTYFTPDMRFARVVTGDGNDTLTGDEGDTVFFTGRGTNSVDGGGGHDTLQFLWDFKAYSQTAYGIQTVIVGADSVDYATDIAALQFADGTLLLDNNPLVNDLFYANQVASLLNSGTTAESHYDAVGWKAGLDPNGVFDTSAYLANHAALKAAGTNPLDYFHETGWKNGDDPSARFDTSLYLKLNPDVAAAGVDPLQHYLQYGIHEGREVRPVVDSAHLQNGGTFDATFYLLANEDVAAAGANAYEHWITYGQKEGRDPNAYFDVSYYLSANPDVAAAGANPLEHYMTYGWKEGRDPSAAFDTKGYLDHYTDVAAAGVDPLAHYLVYGIGEGRQATWDLA